MLEAILHQFPFRILGFHSDNGSEFINRTVAKLLGKLLVEFTKIRANRSQDNALVGAKTERSFASTSATAIFRASTPNIPKGRHVWASPKHFNTSMDYCNLALVSSSHKYLGLLGLPARQTAGNLQRETGVVQANIQTVEDIYLIWTAIASKRPIEAVLSPAPWSESSRRTAGAVYQYGGESESGLEAPGSPANWCCTVLENSVESSYRRRLGARRQTIRAPHPALSTLIVDADADSDAEDQPVAALRRRDSEATVREVGGRPPSATW